MFKVLYNKYVGENDAPFEFLKKEEAIAKAIALGEDTTKGIPVIVNEDGGMEYVPVNFVDMDGVKYENVNPHIFNLTLFPERSLLKPSTPFTEDEIDRPDFKQLVFSMFMTMYVYGGIGLAAPQIGLNRQLFVMDTQLQLTGEARPRVFINPRIVEWEGVVEGVEGCLSIPQLQCKVPRPEELTIEALNIDKQPFTLSGYNLDAACFAHEMEHLMGLTIIRHASKLNRDRYLKSYKKAVREMKRRIKSK